jgi:4-amino-4-deoxy-L-arabinose transferase-like glycosyltransferase
MELNLTRIVDSGQARDGHPVLSLVVPAHDEAENLERLLIEVRAALDPSGIDWELIVVDDGSVDDTPTILAALAAVDRRLRPLRLPERRGQTSALVAGFRAARGSLIATLDADLQCGPAEIPALIAALDGADLACGIRARRHDPPSRRMASALSNLGRRAVVAPGVRDLACPLRVFRADALARVTALTPLFDGAHRWLPALFVLAGLRVVQQPVTHQARRAGVSKYTTRSRLRPVTVELARVLMLRVRQAPQWRLAVGGGLACLAALPFFYRLGAWPLLEPDEARNAEVAREMLALGSWSVPHFNGLPYLDKPVLLFWAIAGCFRMLGIGELAARLPAAIAALVTIALTVALGRSLFGTRRAVAAAAVFATAPLVVIFGRLAIFDMLLTACVTAALYCLVRARLDGPPGRWLPLAGLAMGIGVLAKGPVAFVVPLLAWAAARGALPAGARPRRTTIVLAVAVAIGVVAPWLAAVVAQEPDFLRYAILDESLLRVLSTARFHRGAPVYYYLGVVPLALGAWGVVLAAVAPALVRLRRAGGRDGAAIAFAARAAGAIVLFFSVCASKRPMYILPALIPMALLVGAGLAADPRRAAAAVRGCAIAALVVGIALATAGRLDVVPVGRTYGALAQPVLEAVGVAAVVWGTGALLATRFHPRAALLAAALFFPTLGAAALRPLEPWVETRASRMLAAHIEPDARVIAFGTFRTGLPFYLRRPVTLVSDHGSEFSSNYIEAFRNRFYGGDALVHEGALAGTIATGAPTYVLASPFTLRRLTKLSPRRLAPVCEDGKNLLLRVES